MELQEFLEAMKSSCSFLETEGYTLRKVDTSINRNFWYESHTATEGFRISFGWTQFGDEFHVNGLHCLKRFNIVEKEIQKVLGGKLIDYYTIHKNPSSDYISKELPFDSTENNIRFVLKNQQDIKLFADFVMGFLRKDCEIFFNNFILFEKAYTAYSKLNREQISSLLSGIDNTIFYRELVMKYIAKADDLNDYYTMVINELDSIKNNSTFSRILENFILLSINLQGSVK